MFQLAERIFIKFVTDFIQKGAYLNSNFLINRGGACQVGASLNIWSKNNLWQ
jgi:hypothetical protein